MSSRFRWHSRSKVIFAGCTATALLACALSATAGSAQQVSPRRSAPARTPPHPTTLTVNARLVVLDVVVTDAHGQPVDNLTRNDFRAFENGQPQSIRTFDPPSAHILSSAAQAASGHAVFDPAQPASFGQSPVTILVLDQLNTHFADSSFARRQLHSYLLKQPTVLPLPTALLTVYDNGFKLLQQFTRDREVLLKALSAAPTKYAWELEARGTSDYGPLERLDQSLRALEQIAESVAPIPGRKNLVWVGGGFPSIDPKTLDGADAVEVKDALQHITDTLLNTRITLYAVDPSSSAAGMTEITDEDQQAFALAAGDALGVNADPFGATDDFDRLGPVTGGKVVRGMNNIAAQIASAVDLGAHFYTLGYSPSSTSTAPGQYRKIKVVCLRPGLTVATRSGYYLSPRAKESSADTAAYDLSTAAESRVPLNALHVTAAPDSNAALADEWTVRVTVPSLTWTPQEDGTSTASVYVMAVSLDKHGKMLSHTLHGMTATAKPAANLRDPSEMASFAFMAQPAAKAATLRFIVRDSGTGRMGSFDLPLSKH